MSAIDLCAGSATESPPQHPAMNQRRVLALALPIIGENLLQTTVGVVDTLLVSRLGDNAIAGVGVGAEITYFTLAILSAVSIGATVLVSQAVGAGDPGRANRFARQAISWGLLVAVPLSLLLFLLTPTIIGLFGTESDVRHLAIEYFEVIGATSAMLLLSYLCGAVLRGAGDAKTPLKAAVLANIVNIFAAYGLIFGHLGLPELGVAGSAWGATLGRGVSALYMLRALWKGHTPVSIHGRAGWMPKRHFGVDLFRLGIPAGIEQMMIQGGTTVLVVIVATIGSEALTAQQINFTVMSLALLPGMSLAIATTALVGQSVGARALDDAEKAATIGRRLSAGWMILAASIVVMLARYIVGIFSDDPDVLDIGTRGLRALAFSLPFWGLWVITAGTLRGSGDTRGPMYRGGLTIWTSVVLAFVGVHFFDLGIGWVWSTFLISAPISWIGNIIAFKRRMGMLRREAAALAHQP